MSGMVNEQSKEPPVPQKLYYSPGIRVIAAVLVAALLLSMVANAAVRIRIEPGERTQAATNYLVDNTGYIQADTLQRLQEKMDALSEPVTLLDYYSLAGTQIAEENYSGALESMEACLLLDPGTDAALTQDLQMKKGCLLVLLEQYGEALKALDRVLETDPENADACLVKAQIYAQQQDNKALARALEDYLTLVPGDSQIRLVLAQTYFTLLEFPQAAEQYVRLLENPQELDDAGQVHYLYALTLVQTGDFSTAEENLLEVQKLAPKTDGLDYYLGVCQMSREDYPAAAESMTRSIEAGQMLQLSRYSRGVCGLVIPDYDLALALEDLQTAADYAQADKDPSISQQAQTLIDQLTAIPETTK